MTILGIETSCDETAAAVYSEDKLLSNEISSQLIHSQFGGVVPELASRAHLRMILPVVRKALADAGKTESQLNGIAVTYGPGLVGSILVGLNFAKAMALALQIPWVGINHIEGHLFASFVEDPDPKTPFLALIVSGGHTLLILTPQLGQYTILGKTRDDAAGEAFDKVAKMLDLGYPGGPIIDKLATQGDLSYVRFPKAYLGEESLDFSFSGLKTAVLYHLKSLSRNQIEKHRADIVACFQSAVVDTLVDKTLAAARKLAVKTIVVAGGVACNSFLRKTFQQRCNEEGLKLIIPPPILCTDNAAMIARAGLFKLQQGEHSPFDLSPQPSLKL